MNTLEALTALGVSETDLAEAQRRSLDERGYFYIENALSPEQCAQMAAEVDRIAAEEGERAGTEVSSEAGALRVSNIFNKSTAFDSVLECKPLLAAAYRMLGEMKLHGANVREPLKGHGAQPIHSDSLKVGDGTWCLINALIPFDDVTLENGPTRIIPGSHRWPSLNVPGENPIDYKVETREEPPRWARPGDNLEEHVARGGVEEALEDRAPKEPFAPYPGEVKITVPAGTIVVLNAHMWHSGTQKNDDSRRRVLFVTYTRRDLPQQLNQRKYLTPALYERMSDAQRYLFDIA